MITGKDAVKVIDGRRLLWFGHVKVMEERRSMELKGLQKKEDALNMEQY